MIDPKEVERVAGLARLQLTAEEIKLYSEKLSAVLGYFEELKAVPTDGVEPLVTPTEIEDHFREDEHVAEMSPEEALKNAPAKSGNLFKVPPVV